MMTVLITGGTGFIGSRLALRCRDAGDQVRVLAPCRTPTEQQRAAELRTSGIEVHEASVTDRPAVRAAMEGVGVVYHLAAAQHEANVPDKYYYDINVDGTRNVLASALDARVGRVVHGSTIGVYGIARNGPVTDDSPLEPDNIYGVTKLAGERVVREFASALPVAIVRISETYGPSDWRLLKLFRGMARGRFAMIGPGHNLHHPIYVDDLVDGLRCAAVSRDAPGRVMVLAGPDVVTTREMVGAIGDAVGRRAPRFRVPLTPLMLTAALLETTLGPLGIQPPLHRRRMNFFVKSFRFTCAAARDALDFKPRVPFAEGAARSAAWYREQSLI
jgi:nucleoside-diphosphate-sugar epimerase